jgi:hypothetical protein
MNWTFFLKVFTAVFAFIGSLAIIGVLRQIQLTSWIKAQEIFTDPEFREDRKMVLQRYHQKRTEWTQPEKEKALLVCTRMDEFARIVPFMRPFVREKTVLKIWGDPLGKCWHVLKNIVDEERRKTNWEEKWKAFEDLGKKAYEIVKLREEQKKTEIQPNPQ